MHFLPKLQQAWSLQDSLLTVGLDPDIHKFPQGVGRDLAGIYTFCQGIVKATAPYACAIKPQIAYFAALRAEEVLEDLCRWIQKEYPHLLLVLDAKRGDIGSTAEQYAREAFERYQADAVTINPYMGFDSAQPYLEWQDKGVFVLCRTSNKGGDDFQNLLVAEQPLYQQVARQVAEKWNRNAQCGLVVGATYPHEIAQVRAIVGDTMPLLIPGIGAQGGDVVATVTAGQTRAGTGMLINSSRAIIYASSGEDWSAAAAQAAAATQQAIQAAKKAASSDRF